jgi:nucleoside-triphosphatase THEP1
VNRGVEGAVLITGVYGSGKSSVAQQIADLREAAVWVAGSLGVGIEEVTVSNDRPIREVAAEILEWLDWGDFAVA